MAYFTLTPSGYFVTPPSPPERERRSASIGGYASIPNVEQLGPAPDWAKQEKSSVWLDRRQRIPESYFVTRGMLTPSVTFTNVDPIALATFATDPRNGSNPTVQQAVKLRDSYVTEINVVYAFLNTIATTQEVLMIRLQVSNDMWTSADPMIFIVAGTNANNVEISDPRTLRFPVYCPIYSFAVYVNSLAGVAAGINFV